MAGERALTDSNHNLDKGFLTFLENTSTFAFAVDDNIIRFLTGCLQDSDILLIKRLFSLFLQDNYRTNLLVEIPNFSRDGLFTFQNFNRTNCLQHPIFANSNLLNHAPLFIGMLSALQENGINVDVKKWQDVLYQHIDTYISEKRQRDGADNFFKAIVFLAKVAEKDETTLKKLLPFLLQFIVSVEDLGKNFRLLINLLEDQYGSILEAMQAQPYYFFHEACKYASDNNSAFGYLLYKMKVTCEYDAEGNNFLHLCSSDSKFLEEALKQTSNINHKNTHGNTALHNAAEEDDLLKAQFLLKAGADPNLVNNQGKTAWTICEKSLYHYHHCAVNGITFPFLPKIINQTGWTCGLYALNCAFDCLMHSYPNDVVTTQLPARASDVKPKAKDSWRKRAKQMQITKLGEVYSIYDLQQLVTRSGYKSFILEIENKQQWLKVIEIAMKQRLPIILPFAATPQDTKSIQLAKSSRVHWATIIGLTKDKILLAQWGRYDLLNVNELFNDFFEIEDEVAPQFFAKQDKHWSKFFKKEDLPVYADAYLTLDQISLDKFRRKLIFIMPPHYDLQLLLSEINSAANKRYQF